MIEIDNDLKQIITKVCTDHFVDKLYLFGSAISARFDEGSDIDLVVEFSNKLDVLHFAENYFSLLNALKNIFQREIDLLSYRALKNPILIAEIDKSKVQLYAA